MKPAPSVLALCVVLVGTVPCAAQDMPKYETYRDRFDEVKSQYGDRWAAVVLEDRADVEMSSRGFIQTVDSECAFAVLDPDRAREAIDLVFPISPSTKVKHLRAWSWTPGDAKPHFSKPDDVHIRKTIGSWKEARISIPGVVPGSLCGVQYRYTRSGLSGGRTFRWSFPVVQASFSLHIPWLGSDKSMEEFNKYIAFEVRGEAEDKVGVSGSRGYYHSWRFRDVQAIPKEPLAPARDRPETGVILRSRNSRWANMVRGYTAGLDAMPAPAFLLKDLKSRVDGEEPDVIIREVADYLDDPAHFRLSTAVRYPYSTDDPADIARRGEGSPLDKAILAHLLLRDLGVENVLAMGASLYGVNLDWDTVTPRDLDATLLFFPDQPMGLDFWDVADSSTPFGRPGPDLNSSILVLVKGDRNPVSICRILPGRIDESRRTTLVPAEDGSVGGEAVWRFCSWPSFRGLDPFDSTVPFDDPLERVVGSRARLSSPRWILPTVHHFRCSTEDPSDLAADVTMEATPRGEIGWELKPLFWAAPEQLPARLDPERRTRAHFDRDICVVDTTIIRAAVPPGESLPEGIKVANPLGSLSCSWEAAGDSIVASRKLFIRSGDLEPEKVKYYNEILGAWQKTMTQEVSIRVQP